MSRFLGDLRKIMFHFRILIGLLGVLVGDCRGYKIRIITMLVGLEPTRDKPNRFLVDRLNRSAIASPVG